MEQAMNLNEFVAFFSFIECSAILLYNGYRFIENGVDSYENRCSNG